MPAQRRGKVNGVTVILTRRIYAGTKVVSRSFRGFGEKQVGLDSAAVAIITECAPVKRYEYT